MVFLRISVWTQTITTLLLLYSEWVVLASFFCPSLGSNSDPNHHLLIFYLPISAFSGYVSSDLLIAGHSLPPLSFAGSNICSPSSLPLASIFSFLAMELPGQIISKRIGPDVFVPIQICAWGLLTLGQFFLSGRTSFLLCRSLLGWV